MISYMKSMLARSEETPKEMLGNLTARANQVNERMEQLEKSVVGLEILGGGTGVGEEVRARLSRLETELIKKVGRTRGSCESIKKDATEKNKQITELTQKVQKTDRAARAATTAAAAAAS